MEEMWREPGKKIWSKWVETMKDPNDEDARCRLCATEVNTGGDRMDCFAATPPLKLVRFVLSWAATHKPKKSGEKMVIVIFDISVAFFHGKARLVLYVVPPKDLRKPGVIWRLLKSLYGTRDASQVFAEYVSDSLRAESHERSCISPCLYFSEELENLMAHHGDDFIGALPESQLETLKDIMNRRFKVKFAKVVGEGFDSEVDFLHRRVLYTGRGFAWEQNEKYVKEMIKGFGWEIEERMKSDVWNMTVTPGSKTIGHTRDSADKLDPEACTTFRSQVGLALYIGQDRPECQFATKEAARHMSNPTRFAQLAVKRLAKYYSEAPCLRWEFEFQDMPASVYVVTDANWAGDTEGMRSTSCGWIYFGGHLLETYSSTQQIVALSTAESEYISITKGAAHGLELRSVLLELGFEVPVIVASDSKAGRAMATRRGVGRVRHLDARLLWVQELVAKGVLKMETRPGEENEADIGTKHLDINRMTKLMKKSPLRPPKGWFQWVVASVGYRGAAANNRVVDSSAVACYAVKEDIESQAWTVGLAMLLAVAMLVCMMLAWARMALRESVGTKAEKAAQTSDQSSPAYWGMLVDDLRRECVLRNLVVARTKLEIVDVLLQSDMEKLDRPEAWLSLRVTTNEYRA